MNQTRSINLIVILGPTATGKTRLAARLAHAMGAEIISADSRQVYRRMDLGTGKDIEDYHVEGDIVPSYLIDICEPGEKYNVFAFQQDFYRVFDEIHAHGGMSILCGGTGMYIESVTRGYDLPQVERNESLREQLQDKSLTELRDILAGYRSLHNRSDTDTRARALRAIEIQEYLKTHSLPQEPLRPEIRPLFLGLQMERSLLRQRIALRLKQRLDEGMVQEVRDLLDQGLTPEDLIYYGLEYKFITQHLTGELSYDAMVQKLYTAICQFAKRQMTWFRRMERQGVLIHWLDGEADPLSQAMTILEGPQP